MFSTCREHAYILRQILDVHITIFLLAITHSGISYKVFVL